MRYRPIDRDPDDPRLARLIPDDFEHVAKYPLTALPPEERPVHVPVVIGVNWYVEFDNPEQDDETGETFIAREGGDSLTEIRGGHCVCLEPGSEDGLKDMDGAYEFYDQGAEGACVGFGWSRCMSILNQEFYTARWLWDRAKETDEWDDTNPGDDNGTSVRAAGEILRNMGHVDWQDDYSDDDADERSGYTPDSGDGIAVFRWAESVEDVHSTLGNSQADELGAVPILNSWGSGYPQRVWMPDSVLERLMNEQGEVAIPTDR